MPRGAAVTHADLDPSPRKTDLGSRTGAVLIALTVLCGLLSFVLCLIAEATHTQVTWVSASDDSEEEQKYDCVYSGSGKMPLFCGAGAFLLMAMAMVLEHTYILIAVSKLPPPAADGYWEHELGSRGKSLTWQAAFFFVTTWVCFAVGEILLLIGLSVESGHLTNNWLKPRPNCLIVREGLFCAAGVFSLATVFLAAGLYLAALRIQRVIHERDMFRRQVLETSVFYASPPRSPDHNRVVTSVPRENPVVREDSNVNPALVRYYSSLVSSKTANLVQGVE